MRSDVSALLVVLRSRRSQLGTMASPTRVRRGHYRYTLTPVRLHPRAGWVRTDRSNRPGAEPQTQPHPSGMTGEKLPEPYEIRCRCSMLCRPPTPDSISRSSTRRPPTAWCSTSPFKRHGSNSTRGRVKIGPGAPWVARSNAAQLLDMVLAAYGSKAILVDMDVDGPRVLRLAGPHRRQGPQRGRTPRRLLARAVDALNQLRTLEQAPTEDTPDLRGVRQSKIRQAHSSPL